VDANFVVNDKVLFMGRLNRIGNCRVANMNVNQRVKQEAIQILKGIDLLRFEAIEETLEVPPQPTFGDLASNVCLSLSKKLKRPPQKIAEEIVSKIKIPKDSLFTQVEARSGYVNFHFNHQKLAAFTLKTISELGDSYGSSEAGKGKKVIVEFPSVNPGKPWHIGHARNAILGDSVQRILRFNGFDAEAQDYIDDLGLQVAQALWGVLNLPKGELPKREGLLEKEDQWQGRVYVTVANMFEERAEVQAQVRETMRKMEFGDPAIKGIHKQIVDECLRAQYETAFRLGIYHDLKVHESDIIGSGLYKKAYEIIMKSDKIARETSGPNAGCLVAKLEEFPEFRGMAAPDKILVRSDGTATYTGKDVVFQMWKFGLIDDPMKYKIWMAQPNGRELWTTAEDGETSERFAHVNMVINVIGSEQTYPQKVLRYILKLMGYEEQFKNSFHLAHEHVWLKEGEKVKRFSGRAGTWIGFSADEVLDEAVRRAYGEVDKRHPSLAKREKVEIAEKIGVAAFRYSMLNTGWDKVVVFDYDKALSFEGETGPYLQYAHTRICGILRKAGKWKPNFEVPDLTEHEKVLIKILMEFPDMVEQAAKDLRPLYLCDYAHRLATALDQFYEACPVLRAETEGLRNFRLTLVNATKTTLKNALNLIGIEAPEKM